MQRHRIEINGEPERVLIIRLSALGDVVNCLPALEALHELWPRATFDWVTESLGCLPLEGHRLLARVLRLPRREWERDARSLPRWPRIAAEFCRFVRELRRERYRFTVDFQGNLRSSLVHCFARSGPRFTHHASEVKERGDVFANTPPVPSGRVLRARKHLHLVRSLGWSGADPTPSLPGSWRLPMHGAILLHPFVSRSGSFKSWPRGAYAALARELAGCGREVWVSWGPGEREAALELVAACGGSAKLAPIGEGSGALLDLLRGVRLAVAADTGILHLAAAAGIPTVGLYGPKDPRIYAPYGRAGRVVRASIPCSPCNLRACEHAVCMQLISPAQVARAVRELLLETEELTVAGAAG
ncbi:MAG: glycosyltransferase family 9 protein [Planctomycetes bacterium]|nr:glycosyltransferase family 9 protein [Planctomycetota bacterium]